MATKRKKRVSRTKSPAQAVAVDDAVESEGTDLPKHIERLSYFGTDFDVHGLVRRLRAGDIVVPSFDPPPEDEHDIEGFQRKFVWVQTQKERFIESLLLGFPVPGVFLVQQTDKKLLVLDGQQRLRTLEKFYANEFKLREVAEDLQGLTYDALADELRRTLDNTFIHATVVKYEDRPGASESVFQLFERLNAGGTNLYPHEIRVALYHGKLIKLVRNLNGNANWRQLFGKPNPRLKDQELILRFLALYVSSEAYERPLRSFLNSFAREHRNLEGLSQVKLSRAFAVTCEALAGAIGPQAFKLRASVNAALVDALMVGVARRIDSKKTKPSKVKLRNAYLKLVENAEFLTAIGRATADEARVRARLSLATDAFAKV